MQCINTLRKTMIGMLILDMALLTALTAAAPLRPNVSAWPNDAPTDMVSVSGVPTNTMSVVSPTATVVLSSPPPIKSGNPFSFPLPNGFPNLTVQALMATSLQAHGIEPNGSPPTLQQDDLTSFQVLAFNELFEVAFFTDLLFNITNNVQGFQVEDSRVRQQLLNALIAVQAQEELHLDSINKILAANNVNPIQPCVYQFPTTNLTAAITLASTFTDLSLGVFQDVVLRLGLNGDASTSPIVVSIAEQEGEQDGFYRAFNGLIPSAKPFLTAATREFAFSILNQMFVVQGSCPNIQEIMQPIFLPLTLVTPPPVAPVNQTLIFSVSLQSPVSTIQNVGPDLEGLNLVLINGQQIPIVEPIMNPMIKDGIVTFEAFFPLFPQDLFGLTVAALTNSSGPFMNAEAVAAATVAGPGLIEVL